jgi:putative ABC transport system ATP-binding protein
VKPRSLSHKMAAPMPDAHDMLVFENAEKVYERRGRPTRALDGLSLRVTRGEFVAVVGPSGSGKSTFLHLAAALDVPTRGNVRIEGQDTTEMSEARRTELRRYRIGLVFQFFNLLPNLSIDRNIAMPLLLDGRRFSSLRPTVQRLLEQIGLGDRSSAYPDELSGGEMQRVAIARALITDPVLLLADEPTGNLDSSTSAEIMDMIRRTAHEKQRTTVLVTHDPEVADRADRIIRIRDGRVESHITAAAEVTSP